MRKAHRRGARGVVIATGAPIYACRNNEIFPERGPHEPDEPPACTLGARLGRNGSVPFVEWTSALLHVLHKDWTQGTGSVWRDLDGTVSMLWTQMPPTRRGTGASYIGPVTKA